MQNKVVSYLLNEGFSVTQLTRVLQTAQVKQAFHNQYRLKRILLLDARSCEPRHLKECELIGALGDKAVFS